MQSVAFEKFRRVLEALQSDAEYQKLEKSHRIREAQLRKALMTLTQEQREAVTEYIGICSEMDMRAMEIACFTL